MFEGIWTLPSDAGTRAQVINDIMNRIQPTPEQSAQATGVLNNMAFFSTAAYQEQIIEIVKAEQATLVRY